MPQDSNRDIRNSIYDRVSSLFTSPPAVSDVAAYTVYNEELLRQVQAKTLTPVRPCLFLVDAPIRPADTALPLIVLEITTGTAPFELGNDQGMAWVCRAHCFGRQRGEASLLSYFLQRHFKPLSIYNYADPDALILREKALLEPVVTVEQGPRLTDAEKQGGAFDFWYIVTISGSIRDA